MLGQHGACPVVTWKKQEYKIGFNTQSAKARFEELVRSHVVRQAIQTKREIGGVDGDEAYAVVQDKLDRGHYRTLNPGWLAVLDSPDGAVLFLQSLLQAAHPDMNRDDVAALAHDEPEQVRAALVVAAPSFFDAVLASVNAPADVKARVRAEIATALDAAFRTSSDSNGFTAS